MANQFECSKGFILHVTTVYSFTSWCQSVFQLRDCDIRAVSKMKHDNRQFSALLSDVSSK